METMKTQKTVVQSEQDDTALESVKISVKSDDYEDFEKAKKAIQDAFDEEVK